MDIHEYQAKELLAEYGVPVPRGEVAESPDRAMEAANRIGGSSWVVKAQIHAGDRGKAGGVQVVHAVSAVGEAAANLLGRILVTPQTGPAGIRVRRVYVEQGCSVQREAYLGVLVDRSRGRVTLVAAAEGGLNIEELAARSPEKIRRVAVTPDTGLAQETSRDLATYLGFEGEQAATVERVVQGCYRAFTELDAALVEINPLAVSAESAVLALDVKMSFDDNALFRHPELEKLRDEESDPARLERTRHGYNYVKLEGNIGCVVTGAGLALATMDILRLHGGDPANFLDLPPTANRVQVAAAMRHILTDRNVKAILINAVGGGMTRCDVIAEGIMTAAREQPLRVPLVVRFTGTSREMGMMLLQNSRVPFTPAYDFADAADKAVRAAGGRL